MQSLYTAQVKECYGYMHAPLAALLHRDAAQRSTCYDVFHAFDKMLAASAIARARPVPVASRPWTCGLRRSALVIGNSDYDCAKYHGLRAPAHDALRMKQELQARAFHVSMELDLNCTGVRRALERFVMAFKQRQLSPASPSEVRYCAHLYHSWLWCSTSNSKAGMSVTGAATTSFITGQRLLCCADRAALLLRAWCAHKEGPGSMRGWC